MNKKRIIRILGGGISGLTVAINLRIRGFNVEVYEVKDYCGKQTNDFQYLENWVFDKNVLEFLKSINIKIDFYIKPRYTNEFLSPTLKSYVGTSKYPLMYLVKRGKDKDTIDSCLEKQAKDLGVKIIFNSKLKAKDADIIACCNVRPSDKKAGLNVLVSGIKFDIDYPDCSAVILDNDLSENTYSYFIVNDNKGEITSANPVGIKNYSDRLSLVIKKFENKFNIKIGTKREEFLFASFFQYSKLNFIDGQYYIGESAGFQDYLAAFGMVYAFKSGYLVAKSIDEGLDYDRLWKIDFGKQLKVSLKNRDLFDRLSNKDFEKIISLANNIQFVTKFLKVGTDLRLILKKFYNSSFYSLLGYLKLKIKK